MKNAFETHHNEMKFVLRIKESNLNAENGSKFSHFLTVRAEGAPFFLDIFLVIFGLKSTLNPCNIFL